jgi:hypothetical protein
MWKLITGECVFSWVLDANGERTGAVDWTYPNAGVLLQHGYWAWVKTANCPMSPGTFCPMTPRPQQTVEQTAQDVSSHTNPNYPASLWIPFPLGWFSNKKNQSQPDKELCPKCRNITAQELHDTRRFRIEGINEVTRSGG